MSAAARPLFFHCDIEAMSTINNRNTGITEEEVAFQFWNRSMLFILKAYVSEHHKLEHWDKKLMLIRDIQIVQSPHGNVPSLVGLYNVENEVMNVASDALLFYSTIQSIYKLIPRVCNRKSRSTW